MASVQYLIFLSSFPSYSSIDTGVNLPCHHHSNVSEVHHTCSNAAFILNFIQQIVFLLSPTSSKVTCVSLEIHPTIHPCSCYIAFTPWEASAFHFNLKTLCFLHYSFFHKFLMLARLAKYKVLCLPKGTMKNWIKQTECSHFTMHCTIETYINITSARIVWQNLFKV